MPRLDDLNRQIELAAFVFEHPDRYSESDLARQFHLTEATLRRDVRALREMGLDMRSRKMRYRVDLSLDQINFLITTAFAFGNQESLKNLPLIIEKLGNRSVSFFVACMRAIRHKQTVEIAYRSARSQQPQWRTVTPVAFYNSGKSCYLVAIHGDVTKIYTPERISDFRFSGQASPAKSLPTLGDLFRHSWGSFTGGKLADVRLRFKDDLEDYLSDKFWVDELKMRQTADGLEVSMRVKLSNEFTAWLLGWGDAVTVIEPEELRDAVVHKARSVVRLYEPPHRES